MSFSDCIRCFPPLHLGAFLVAAVVAEAALDSSVPAKENVVSEELVKVVEETVEEPTEKNSLGQIGPKRYRRGKNKKKFILFS